MTLPRVHWPVVELLFEPAGADDLAPLVRSLARLCRPAAPDHTNVVSARLLSSPTAPEARLATREPSIPFAVVVRHTDQLDHPVSEAAAALVVLSSDRELLAAAGERAVALSTHPVRTVEVLAVPPFLRERLRREGGLPDDLVVTIGRPGARPLADPSIATALRLAAVADVCGPWTTTALALGAPVVTDETTAGVLGAEDGTHLLVADAGHSRTVAADLARDPVACARIAAAGRQLVEGHHDPDRTATLLVDRLGLPVPADQPSAVGVRLGERLAGLGTPGGHPIEVQIASRLSGLGVAPRAGGR